MISSFFALLLLIPLKYSLIKPILSLETQKSSYLRDGQQNSYVSITINITRKGMPQSVIRDFVPITPIMPNKPLQIMNLLPVKNFVKSQIKHDACSSIQSPLSDSWAALVKPGNCKFLTVMTNLNNGTNISAILLFEYSHFYEHDLVKIHHVPILLLKDSKFKILNLLFNTSMQATVTFGEHSFGPSGFIHKNSVLFVSISFILIMIISFAWLIFYYVQRFRYIHAKEKFARRLENAARKAITKIPERTIRSRDDPLITDESSLCVVCLEGYQLDEVLRELPCKHSFHRKCVDPWLIDQRKCPICKMDILQMYDPKSSTLYPDSNLVMDRDSLADRLIFIPRSNREISRRSIPREGSPDSSESYYQLVDMPTVIRAEMAT